MKIVTTSASKNDLRNFGLLMGFMISLIFGLVIPWIWELEYPLWPWIVAILFVVVGLAVPTLLSMIFSTWMKFAHVLGWINTRIILSAIFYAIIFPIGMVFRLLNKDPMRRKLDSQLPSYKIPSNQPKTDNLKRPY